MAVEKGHHRPIDWNFILFFLINLVTKPARLQHQQYYHRKTLGGRKQMVSISALIC